MSGKAKTLTKLFNSAVTTFSDHLTTRSASTTTTATTTTTTGTLTNFIKLSKAVDSCSKARKAKRSVKLKKCFESKLPSELAIQSVRLNTTRSVNGCYIVFYYNVCVCVKSS